MTRRRRGIYLFLSVLACMGLVIPAASASPRAPLGYVPSKAASQAIRNRPAPSLSDTVAAIGAGRFSNAYGGQATSASGKLIIYVVAAHGAAFLAAVRAKAAHESGPGDKVVYVPHTWAQLNRLTMRIAAQQSWRRAHGLRVARWGPDAASSKVVIDLRSYSRTAARELVARYGSRWVSVSHRALRQRLVFLSRFTDKPPFFGGDRIFSPKTNQSVACTSGFTMIGNKSGNHFLITAGHCGNRAWWTNTSSPQSLGSTSTDYFSANGGSTTLDAQTIGPDSSTGTVWGDGSTEYFPASTLLPGVGLDITFDGFVSGVVGDVPVTDQGPFCTTVSGVQTCHLGLAERDNVKVCQNGDSGGPVFQRTPTSSIKAVGIITAGTTNDHVCAYTEIGPIQSITNTSLDTTP